MCVKMTGVSFSVAAMDTTDTTAWWQCPGCGVEAELALESVVTAGPAAQPCPDCGEAMVERLPWEVAA